MTTNPDPTPERAVRLQARGLTTGYGPSHQATEDMAMPLLDTLLSKRAEVLKAACRHGASNVRLFGLVARRTETPSSDVDILID